MNLALRVGPIDTCPLRPAFSGFFRVRCAGRAGPNGVRLSLRPCGRVSVFHQAAKPSCSRSQPSTSHLPPRGLRFAPLLIAPEADARSGGGAKKLCASPGCRLVGKARGSSRIHGKQLKLPKSSCELSLNLLIEGQVERLVADKAVRDDDEGPAGEPLCKPPWIAGIAAERLRRGGPLNNLFD